jgi:hypothetical protein
MIASDTNLLVALIKGEKSFEVEKLTAAIQGGNLALPPIVITEILSDPAPSRNLRAILSNLEILPVLDGFWARAGETRSTLFKAGLRTKTADTLLAQSCIDHDVPLMTRDRDFQRFAKHCGLRLA